MSAVTIWKFQFDIGDAVEIEMPGDDAHILHVECQMGFPCVWAMVDPEKALVTRRFRLFGTGHPITDVVGKHVGTFQQGPLVWHMFEEPA